MKVLQVIDTLHVGGAEKMTVELSNILYKNNMDVAVLLIREDGVLVKELEDKIPIYRLNRTKRLNISKIKEVADIVSNFDLVHIHLKHNYRYISLACKVFRVHKPKLILHDHSHTLRIQKGTTRAGKDWLFKNIFKPEYYIGVHNDQLFWANNYLNIQKSHCFLLENVVPKKEVPLSEKAPSGVVMVGNITRIKNIEFAFKLIQQIHEKLTIYGNVIDLDYFKELKLETERLEISNQVNFIHEVANVQPFLSRFKFALHTSKKETGPLVLIEYLAHQLPFVSYASGQVYETLKDQIPGCFCNSFSESDWLQHIDDLHLVDGEKLQACYYENFSVENYLKKCLKIYNNILHS